jgi:hypothetical protein
VLAFDNLNNLNNLNLKDDNAPQQNAAWSVKKTQAQDSPQNSEELFGNKKTQIPSNHCSEFEQRVEL